MSRKTDKGENLTHVHSGDGGGRGWGREGVWRGGEEMVGGGMVRGQMGEVREWQGRGWPGEGTARGGMVSPGFL